MESMASTMSARPPATRLETGAWLSMKKVSENRNRATGHRAAPMPKHSVSARSVACVSVAVLGATREMSMAMETTARQTPTMSFLAESSTTGAAAARPREVFRCRALPFAPPDFLLRAAAFDLRFWGI